MIQFVECASCAAKPGSPLLCEECIARRESLFRPRPYDKGGWNLSPTEAEMMAENAKRLREMTVSTVSQTPTSEAVKLEEKAAPDRAPEPEIPMGWYMIGNQLYPSKETAENAVRVLLAYIRENPDRDGLKETPARVAKALHEMTSGYSESPEKILSKVFDEPYDEVIIVRDIPFTSLCEHHMLVFEGTVDVGYLPGQVVGLSKIARLVDCFSRRLQIQERLTKQIEEAIRINLNAKGVAVVVRATHSCMSCRGVRKPGASMVTSALSGVFRDKPEARSEFLALCGK